MPTWVETKVDKSDSDAHLIKIFYLLVTKYYDCIGDQGDGFQGEGQFCVYLT